PSEEQRPSRLRGAFHRGFIGNADAKDDLDGLSAKTPIARLTRKNLRRHEVEQLWSHRHLQRLDALELSGEASANEVFEQLQSPSLRRLRAVGLEWSFGGAVLARLRDRRFDGVTLSTVTADEHGRVYDEA